ncbi:MAG: pentapeptide repeat-containing protein [Hyphomicrobium sp.]|nr:pentapeptide repeat-containing protein [Hyphomicrobium sp.]
MTGWRGGVQSWITAIFGLSALIGPASAFDPAIDDPTTREIRAAEGLANQTTAGEVTAALFGADHGQPVDLSGRGLKSLDLSELDFKGARLARSDVFGTNLARSNLEKTDLAGARLDRTVLTFTRFAGANLEGATLMRPTIYSDLRVDWREAPVFDSANLRGTRLTGRFDGSSFMGADLSGFNFSPHEPRADISFLPRNFCQGCKFDRARLRGADLDDAGLSMSSFQGADLAGARLTRTDLSRADLRGADLTGADLSRADLADADLRGVVGLETVKGLGLALNLERAIR